jgi:rubrerythrin
MTDKEMSPIEALHYALDEEKKAHAFYTAQALAAKLESTRKMFEFLAAQEAGHIALIEEELDQGFYQEM